MKGPRAFEPSGIPLHSDNETIVRERLYLDKANPDVLNDEITTIDHALTRPLLAIPLLEQDIAEHAKQTRTLFETFMQEHGCGSPTTAPSSGWLEEAPEGDHFVGSHGRLFDVIVLGRPGHDLKGSRMTTLEAALFESGRPILLAPPSPRPQMGTNVLIAWNCSTEQARATAFAMPLLKQASRVVVLTVEVGAAVPGPTGQQLCRYSPQGH